MFYTRRSDHLGISTHTNSQNSHPFVSHIICGVIIWKSQSIQTLKTRTLVHNTSLLSLRHQIKLFSCPESKRVYRDFLSVDSYNYEPAKTEWSQSWWDVFFLAYISLMPPQYAITTRVKKSMAGYHLSYKEQVWYNDSPRLWKIKLSTKFTPARQLLHNQPCILPEYLLFAWKYSGTGTHTLPFSEEEHYTLFSNASLSYLAVVFRLCSFWI